MSNSNSTPTIADAKHIGSVIVMGGAKYKLVEFATAPDAYDPTTGKFIPGKDLEPIARFRLVK